MKKLLLYFIAIYCCLFSAYDASATHLMGGNLTYTFLGQTGSLYNYEVTIKLYRYCASGSSNLPNNMELGAYEQDTLNPNDDKNLTLGAIMPLISQQFITPPSSDTSCHFTTVVCVEEGLAATGASAPTLPSTNLPTPCPRHIPRRSRSRVSPPGLSGWTRVSRNA